MSVGHPICCRKATAQILFLGYAPYPFQNFDSDLENTPLPHVYSGKKKAPAIADVAKAYSGVYGIHLIPPVAPFHTCIMDAAIPPFNRYARFFGVVSRNMVRGGSAYSVLRFWARPGLVKWGVVFRFDTFLAFWGVCRLHYAL